MKEEKNSSDKNVGSIERLIEELTKVRPDELSKDGLKLFEYINEIIDRNKELEEENKNLKTRYDKYGRVLFTPEAIAEKHIPKSKIKILKEENENKINEMRPYKHQSPFDFGVLNGIDECCRKLLEDK